MYVNREMPKREGGSIQTGPICGTHVPLSFSPRFRFPVSRQRTHVGMETLYYVDWARDGVAYKTHILRTRIPYRTDVIPINCRDVFRFYCSNSENFDYVGFRAYGLEPTFQLRICRAAASPCRSYARLNWGVKSFASAID